MAARRALADRIVDETLELAEEVGWQHVHLRAVADRLGAPLAEVRRHYRDLDAVADAWLARADRAMLARRDDAGFAGLPAEERLYACITRWLDSLAGHRRVTAEIFRAKLYLGHPHHNIALVLWLSRTVQWLREAAHLEAAGRRRQTEEIGLSALFVATLVMWSRDQSENQGRTRHYLSRRLDLADRIMARLWPPEQEPAEEASID
jgi:AcrR family transcriptional regulator